MGETKEQEFIRTFIKMKIVTSEELLNSLKLWCESEKIEEKLHPMLDSIKDSYK